MLLQHGSVTLLGIKHNLWEALPSTSNALILESTYHQRRCQPNQQLVATDLKGMYEQKCGKQLSPMLNPLNFREFNTGGNVRTVGKETVNVTQKVDLSKVKATVENFFQSSDKSNQGRFFLEVNILLEFGNIQ